MGHTPGITLGDSADFSKALVGKMDRFSSDVQSSEVQSPPRVGESSVLAKSPPKSDSPCQFMRKNPKNLRIVTDLDQDLVNQEVEANWNLLNSDGDSLLTNVKPLEYQTMNIPEDEESINDTIVKSSINIKKNEKNFNYSKSQTFGNRDIRKTEKNHPDVPSAQHIPQNQQDSRATLCMKNNLNQKSALKKKFLANNSSINYSLSDPISPETEPQSQPQNSETQDLEPFKKIEGMLGIKSAEILQQKVLKADETPTPKPAQFSKILTPKGEPRVRYYATTEKSIFRTSMPNVPLKSPKSYVKTITETSYSKKDSLRAIFNTNHSNFSYGNLVKSPKKVLSATPNKKRPKTPKESNLAISQNLYNKNLVRKYLGWSVLVPSNGRNSAKKNSE
jgi:hypothetical protein